MTLTLLQGEKATVTHDDNTTYSVHTELLMDASPEKVWAVLTDFDKLKEWSPNLIRFEGEFRKDGQAKVTFLIGVGNMTQDFNHPLVHFEEGKMFGWSAPIPHMGMKDNHKYIVQPVDGEPDKTLFIQTDQFHGQGAHLIGGMLSNGAMQGYAAFNRALKKRVEEM